MQRASVATHSTIGKRKHDNFLLGDLLVREGLVTQQDIARVLAIQEQERKLAKLPLGQVLVGQCKITELGMARLLNHQNLRKHLGTLAVEKQHITSEQLMYCLQKKGSGRYLGQILVEEGFLNSMTLIELLKDQAYAEKIGDLAVKLDMVTHEDVRVALKIQKAHRSVGEICCDLHLISPLDLYPVLRKHKKQTGIGEILVNLGYINQEQLTKSLQEQLYSKDSLGDILVRNKVVTRAHIWEAMLKQLHIPFKSFAGFTYSERDKHALTKIISQKYAEKHLLLPIAQTEKDLTIAIMRPDKLLIIRELRQMYSQLTISCVFINEAKFGDLFAMLYSLRLNGFRGGEEREESDGEPVLPVREEADQTDLMQIELSEETEEEKSFIDYGVQDIETEELVNYIIKYGISHGASDIHFERDRKGAKLRYRVDGVLRDVQTEWLREKIKEKSTYIVSRIKVMSNLDISEKRLPQDGVFRINYFDRTENQKYNFDFRVATCPAITGENVSIRILDSRKAKVGLAQLNHSPHVLDSFKTFLKSAAGMVLVTGPTGSGKSSTLYAALQYIFDPTRKIITAEDPIEYSFPGIMQTQVNTKIGLTFAKLLRSFLRLDPDVILVGEIRDHETARIGFDAAQTGHLVLSTLHTNDAISTLGRLEDLEIDRTQITSSLSCILAQRLVRKICPTCIAPYTPEEDEWRQLFEEYPAHLSFFQGIGCKDCGFTGLSGRTLLSEIFVPGDFKSLAKGATIEDLKIEAVKRGMKTMIDDGLLKLGDTTLAEILRVVPHEMIRMYRKRKLIKGGGADLADSCKDGWRIHGFTLADPASEEKHIDQMFEEYSTMAVLANIQVELDRELFGRFIVDSYGKVSRSSHCREVMFYFELRDDVIQIFAIPRNR
jgi:type IV pilus assembly protein PilB